MYCRGFIKENIRIYTEHDIDLLLAQKRDEFNSSLFFIKLTFIVKLHSML